MLEHQIHLPDGVVDGARVAVLLHGRGSHEGDLQGLRDHLPDGTVLLTPRALHPGRPWGYGPGWAWYRYVADDRVVPETLEASLEALDGFLQALPDLVPVRPGPLVLGGFSQGGTTSLVYGLRHPERVQGVAVFSGFLPEHETERLDERRVEGLDVFWGHGTRDPAIPHELGRRGREALASTGIRLEARDYDMGHEIVPEQMRDAAGWMGRLGREGSD